MFCCVKTSLFHRPILSTSMSGVLKVVGNTITRDGEPIVLKGKLVKCVRANHLGSSLGGWSESSASS